jgi:hypothetical protein
LENAASNAEAAQSVEVDGIIVPASDRQNTRLTISNIACLMRSIAAIRH